MYSIVYKNNFYNQKLYQFLSKELQKYNKEI